MTKILVVEDEESIRETLDFLLTKEGYQVHTLASGQDAVLEFEKFNPDLVLLDIMLPGLSGVEITKKIRQKTILPFNIMVFLEP